MRMFDTCLDANAFKYLHQQCSEVADAVRTNWQKYDPEPHKEFSHVYFVARSIHRGIELGIPQPPQYLRAWRKWDKMRLTEDNGRYFLSTRFMPEGKIEILDYVPREDGEEEFLVILRPVAGRFQAVFFCRGEYRHRDMVKLPIRA